QENDVKLPEFRDLSLYASNVTVYIAGFVARSLKKLVKCEECYLSLFHTEPDHTRYRSDYILLTEKDNGGLCIPSEDLVKICKITESTIRQHQGLGVKGMNRRDGILKSCLAYLLRDTSILKELRTT